MGVVVVAVHVCVCVEGERCFRNTLPPPPTQMRSQDNADRHTTISPQPPAHVPSGSCMPKLSSQPFLQVCVCGGGESRGGHALG